MQRVIIGCRCRGELPVKHASRAGVYYKGRKRASCAFVFGRQYRIDFFNIKSTSSQIHPHPYLQDVVAKRRQDTNQKKRSRPLFPTEINQIQAANYDSFIILSPITDFTVINASGTLISILIMKAALLLVLCLLHLTRSAHLQANTAFSNWLNSSVTPNSNNPFNKWLNSSSPQSPNAGANPLNDPNFANIIKGQVAGANNPGANDNAFRAFLQSNGVPNATQLPTLQECAQYTIRAGGNIYTSSSNNYRVTCSLPGGKNYTESCFGSANCDYLTCKFLKCSKVSGGGVFRVKI